jgi:protoporphyrinogen oxidase
VSSFGIVGGGFLGMTIALRLAEDGHEVTLYEAAAELGGLASAWQLDDITWDRHYHVTLLSDSQTRGILRELGLDDEMQWVQTRTGCYADGTLYSVSNSIEFLQFPPLRMLDKIRLGWTVFFASRVSNWSKLEAQTVESWLVKHSGRRTFDTFWLPLLRSKLGDNYRHASAAFIWAVIQRLYAARRSGLKQELFGYLPGGYARTIARFAEVLEDKGVHIHLGTRVDSVAGTDDGRAVIRIGGREDRVDHAVVTAAAPIAARLIQGLTEKERSRLESIRYQGIVCASLLLDRDLSPYYVTNITDGGFPFTGVIEMTALVDKAEFGGRSLVYLPSYLPSEDPYLEADTEAIRASFVAGLQRMHPDLTGADIQAFELSRVRYVLPISTLGYSHGVPPLRTSIPSVHLATAAQIVNGTLNVNETVGLANRAAAELRSLARAEVGP